MKAEDVNLYLVGFMGTGKSTVGRAVAHKLGFQAVDSDPITNPTGDDDFYFAGNYSIGFNGLTTNRNVLVSEPNLA